MRKFVVGERYKVGGKHDEAGNIIEITRVGSGRCMYKTIKGKAPEPWTESFDEGSSFAKNLTLSTGEEKVVILRNGNTVTATRYIGGVKVSTGVAKCCPEDSFDFGTGAKIAFDRMFGFAEPTLETAFDWNDFIKGDIFVEVIRNTIDDFMIECEKNNCSWGDYTATKWNPLKWYDDMSEETKSIIQLMGASVPNDKLYIHMVDGKLKFSNDKPKDNSKIIVWENSFDWEAFKNAKFTVRLTKETAKSFLEAAEKNWCRWKAGQKPTKWVPDKEIFYLDCADSGYGRFGWNSTNHDDLEVVEW